MLLFSSPNLKGVLFWLQAAAVFSFAVNFPVVPMPHILDCYLQKWKMAPQATGEHSMLVIRIYINHTHSWKRQEHNTFSPLVLFNHVDVFLSLQPVFAHARGKTYLQPPAEKRTNCRVHTTITVLQNLTAPQKNQSTKRISVHECKSFAFIWVCVWKKEYYYLSLPCFFQVHFFKV